MFSWSDAHFNMFSLKPDGLMSLRSVSDRLWFDCHHFQMVVSDQLFSLKPQIMNLLKYQCDHHQRVEDTV